MAVGQLKKWLLKMPGNFTDYADTPYQPFTDCLYGEKTGWEEDWVGGRVGGRKTEWEEELLVTKC